MNLALELQEVVERLSDNEKLLLLEVAKKFLSEDDDWDEVFPDDLHYIEIAEKELANSETISHYDRKWK